MGLILICTPIPSYGAAGGRSAEVDANDMVVRRGVFTPLGWDEAPGDGDNPFPQFCAGTGAAGCGRSPVPPCPGLGEEDSSWWRFWWCLG